MTTGLCDVIRGVCALTCGLALLAPVAAAQGGIEPFDADGDGDIDADDRALIDAAEVVSVESKSEGTQLQESARAVTVIDTRKDRERTADLGEVLSRAQGIQVRRSGGLGSATRFSLNGLYDEQIRFFLDGVPLQLAGWGSNIADVPVELLQRVDVHRGVVPIALGADALGGAIDLVTDPSWVNRAAASVQVGSFGTQRTSLVARARDAETGMALGLSLSATHAKNDYPVEVKVADTSGAISLARVPRFHDAYAAAGGSAELGLVDRGAVRRALVRLYATRYDKELQSNMVMTVPYGEANYGEAAFGATTDIVVEQGAWRARLLGGVSKRRIAFHDTTTKVYDWFGKVILMRTHPGETGDTATDQLVTEDAAFARLTVERSLGRQHRVRASVAPTATRRGGEDYVDTNPLGRDPIDAKRDLLQIVSGVEYEARTADDAVENVAFAKHYATWTDAEQVQPGFVFIPVDQRTRRFGIGDAARWRVSKELSIKASYEWATRLPSVDELFGNGILIRPSLTLEPERSHNLNLGGHLDRATSFGALSSEINGFARLADRLIFLVPDERAFSYQNVWEAHVLGVEGSAGWVAPGEWATVDASLTWQDARNASSEGTFGQYEGDRVPNRPWLFGSLGATARARDVLRANDDLAVFASGRYVHDFYRGWESLGRRDSKDSVPTQVVLGVGATYALRGARAVSVTVEVQNVTDEVAYDTFGVPKPGRALSVKLSGEM